MNTNKQVTFDADPNLWKTVWVNDYGTQFTKWSLDKEGKLPHSRDDQPALVEVHPLDPSQNCQTWYKNGLKHRDDDKPAWTSNETQIWYQLGLRHRDGDLPAMINNSSGRMMYYKRGQLHRNGDLPAEITHDGTQYWYQCGTMYREGDKPVVVKTNGTQEWKYGRDEDAVLHRTGGPAVIYPDGTVEYWIAGHQVESLDLIK